MCSNFTKHASGSGGTLQRKPFQRDEGRTSFARWISTGLLALLCVWVPTISANQLIYKLFLDTYRTPTSWQARETVTVKTPGNLNKDFKYRICMEGVVGGWTPMDYSSMGRYGKFSPIRWPSSTFISGDLGSNPSNLGGIDPVYIFAGANPKQKYPAAETPLTVTGIVESYGSVRETLDYDKSDHLYCFDATGNDQPLKVQYSEWLTGNNGKFRIEVYQLPIFNLTVTKTGKGTITGGKISCGSQCTAQFSQGTSITLTEISETGYVFDGWGGACSGTATTCNVTMSQAQTVSATFSKPKLTVTPPSGGTITGQSINCGTQCQAEFTKDTLVTLTATPTAGYIFNNWTGACAGKTTTTCSVSMTQAQTVSATFSKPVLSVSKNGTGTVSSSPTGISCGNDCNESYAANTLVTLTATPATGNAFTGWTGICSGTVQRLHAK